MKIPRDTPVAEADRTATSDHHLRLEPGLHQLLAKSGVDLGAVSLGAGLSMTADKYVSFRKHGITTSSAGIGRRRTGRC